MARPSPQTDELPGVPARRAALRLLDAVLRRGDPLDQAAPPVLRAIERGDDRALALAIAQEALRWLPDLDRLIDGATRQILPKDAKARSVLRLMLAQALRLGLPPHAVIATGLPLLIGGPRRLAHGVFSAVLKGANDEGGLPESPALPAATLERWSTAWPDRVEAIAKGLAVPPPLDLSLRDPARTDEWAERLGGTSLAPGHVRLARSGAIEQLEGFAEGAWWVQDLAASVPARLLGPGEGRRVLDLCAAPGGKTMQLAAAGWHVTALDKSARRLERLKENVARVGLSVEVIAADAMQWRPSELYDAVLIDAPCSATGTCRRHPDVLHRLIDQTGLEDLQRALLERASGAIRADGRLVYAVCSLEPGEGEAQAAWVKALGPVPITADQLPAGLTSTPDGWFRSDPGMLAEHGGIDGFFAAMWGK
ncbi:RsmB/NOP family class I SAM-dependent RNA methyltransferase [Novosphingobium sp. AAP93]|uniref:RsmB/NOP family class I SAM-dependent RNA methyltransferase n=1 Tax=Novosphingobium sp. AAP93 TaxID=1523427 RepID=UPI0006B98EF4|nr:methyltransferase domain-containing protein [Novosphingobium sp. AAP93]KPF85226.1 SAM-dependent methyltransferase [Novosphingobium sp. AAP93]